MEECKPMLDRIIGECMVSIINIIMVSKNLYVGIKLVIPIKLLILGGYIKVKEFCIPKLLFGSRSF